MVCSTFLSMVFSEAAEAVPRFGGRDFVEIMFCGLWLYGL